MAECTVIGDSKIPKLERQKCVQIFVICPIIILAISNFGFEVRNLVLIVPPQNVSPHQNWESNTFFTVECKVMLKVCA